MKNWKFEQYAVPQTNWDGLVLWMERGIPPGGFLQAVLKNDLRGACEAADNFNRYHLFDIVNWLYNMAPMDCWGSPAAVEAWRKRHEESRREKRELESTQDPQGSEEGLPASGEAP